jgi:geranylgeranyl pyrophosphate synthase
VRIYGIEKCEELVKRYTDLAISALDAFPEHTYLETLAKQLTDRRN